MVDSAVGATPGAKAMLLDPNQAPEKAEWLEFT